ncbi:MAG: aspartate kinase [Marinilabiliaceae bacterium]|nr:aspartate kinase [Marinilabiliaceae bacterium]
MKIYKFGGASMKDADGVRNIPKIIQNIKEPLVVVVSAMGKTTNAMEMITHAYLKNDRVTLKNKLIEVKNFHSKIIKELFGNENGSESFLEQFEHLEVKLDKKPSLHYDFEYDRIVSFGELMSSAIINDFFYQENLKFNLVDIRTVLKTDDIYRDANVNWELTVELMQKTFNFDISNIYLTQGFLGGTLTNLSTTLGREGSDYSAAILGFALNATDVTIWKDVPGVMNADPRWYSDAQKIDQLSYNEAIELSYYGAQVIHPKTLKPLQNKSIPLYVKSFLNPEQSGTIISSSKSKKFDVPIFVIKQNQVFVTISPKDYSFIPEDKLIEIITIFKKYRIKINQMQNSALHFSACFDKNRHTDELFEFLKSDFFVRYNENAELITIRNYNPSAIEQMTKDKIILNSQVTRKMAMFVLVV